MSTNTIFKGDDTGAFGNQFITITVSNPLLYPISKIEFIVNGGTCFPVKTFTDENKFQQETIILTVNFSSEETAKLNAVNTANIIAYDNSGLRQTAPQTLKFYAQNGVISKNGQSCC